MLDKTEFGTTSDPASVSHVCAAHVGTDEGSPWGDFWTLLTVTMDPESAISCVEQEEILSVEQERLTSFVAS